MKSNECVNPAVYVLVLIFVLFHIGNKISYLIRQMTVIISCLIFFADILHLRFDVCLFEERL